MHQYLLRNAMLMACVFCASILGLTQAGFCQNNSTLSPVKNEKRLPAKVAQKKDKPKPKEDKADSKPKAAKPSEKKPLPLVNEKRSKELLVFVKQNHPEIIPLINSLKKNRKGQYNSAMRTLDREVRTLQSLKQRDPNRYTKSLDQWIVKSKIKLLSAQLAMKKTDSRKEALRKQIRSLIEQ